MCLSAHRETCLSWPCPSPPFRHYYWWCPLPVYTLPWRCSHSRKTLPPCYSSQIKIIAPCHVCHGNWLLSLPFFLPTKSLLFSDFHLKGTTGCFVRRVSRTLISRDILWGCHGVFIWSAQRDVDRKQKGSRWQACKQLFQQGPMARESIVTSCRKDPGR